MRSAYIWNTVSGLLMAFQSVIVVIVISHVCDAAAAGIFTLAYAHANLFLTIGKWGERAYQASDTMGEYSFAEYGVSRIVTSLLMLALGGALLALNAASVGYSPEKTTVIFLMLLFKLVDCVEDVYHGEYQREGRLDVAGRVLTARLLTTIALYVAAIAILRDQLPALALATAYTTLFAVCECVWARHRHSLPQSGQGFSPDKVGKLLLACFALALVTSLQYYLTNAPKYAIDASLDDLRQAYYGYLAMPTFVVSMLSSFIYNPNLTPLGLSWAQRDIRGFSSTVGRIVASIVAITVACDVAAAILGIPILSALYATDLSPYGVELVVLVTGGGFLAVAMLLTSIMAIMRRQNGLIAGNVISAVLAALLCPIATEHFGISGAAWSYLATMVLLVISFLVPYVRELSRADRMRETEVRETRSKST